MLGLNSHQRTIPVQRIDLIIQRAPVVNDAKSKKAHSEQIQQATDPFALVKPVDAKHAKECEQHPGKVVVDWPAGEAAVCTLVHARNKEQVYQPTNEKKSEGEKPDNAREGAAIIKTVGTHEAQYPENVADNYAVTFVVFDHVVHPLCLISKQGTTR